MRVSYRRGIRSWITLAAVCSGALMGETCIIRTRTALIDGSKSFLTNVLLNPEAVAELPFDEIAGDLTGGGSSGG